MSARPPVAVAEAGVILPAGVGNLLPAVGVGDLRPTAGMGDLLSAPVMGVLSIIASAGLLSPTADTEASMPVRCWTGRGLLVLPLLLLQPTQAVCGAHLGEKGFGDVPGAGQSL